MDKYKAMFVSCLFSQKEGIDYEDTFAPVARYTPIKSIISLALVLGWKLHQMDVKTSFLNGEVEEEAYIQQPKGFVVKWKESHLCKLNKSLYGINQSLRPWYSRIDNYL